MASTPSFASESKSRLGKILIAGAVLTGTIASVISDTVANGTESSAKRKYWRDLDQNLGDLSIDQLHLTDASPSNLMFDISSQIHPEMKLIGFTFLSFRDNIFLIRDEPADCGS